MRRGDRLFGDGRSPHLAGRSCLLLKAIPASQGETRASRATVRSTPRRAGTMKKLSVSVALTIAVECILVSAQAPSPKPAPTVAVKTNIPYLDAKPILETLRKDLLPAELQAKTPAEIESAWPGWVSQHDANIRARLERGDEDSIVNLLLFGVTFTKQPRTKAHDILTLATQARSTEILQGRIVQGRVDDMVAGIASPGANERLQFARQVIERRGIDPRTGAGKNQVRRYLVEEIARVFAEYEAHTSATGPSLRFGDRGLSSDTSILSDFAVEQALEAIKSGGMLGAGSIRRVAIVGPGLDFTDKLEGYDFYPQQTFQPFAVIDSLIRLGLARRDDLRVTTFDLSLKINQHLEAALQRARAGGAYVLQLPLETDLHVNPDLVTYWKRFGDRIGEEAKAVAAPLGVGSVQLRAVRVPPSVVMAIIPRDLNIVLQRPEPLAADERFDLIIATNILIYYDVFEQSLALSNVAKMLRPGGFFLSNNNPTFILPTTPMDVVGYTDVVYSDQLNDKDRLVWCRRR